MTDVILVEQEIEPGRTEDAVALFEEVGRMRDTDGVISALEREGVYTESAFLRRTEEADSVLYYNSQRWMAETSYSTTTHSTMLGERRAGIVSAARSSRSSPS